MSEQHSYRQIMKATSIFGGVQVFNIAISIIRSKIIALLLGPTGMGIAGLLTSTTGLVGSLTNFGLGTSAVKDIAAANETGNTQRIATVVTVFRRLVWITGILGALATLILSPWLSQLTFGNKDYTFAFIWLSVTLLLNQLASGHMIMLQGMRKLKYLANANITGSLLGLLISVPIYYVWGIDGIVPTMIITAIASLLRAWYFGRKVKVEKATVNRATTIVEGKGMLKMGFMLSLSGLITTAASYLVRIYISNTGGVNDVGLYTAGFAIIETYVGLIFTAMGTDYYPRLSAISNDNEKISEIVNQQAIIALLILTPVIILFLAFAPIVINILYSTKFFAIERMVSWAILGMFFRAVSWSMGYTLLAKSDSKLFIKTAIGFNTLFLINNIIGYKIGSLNGMGISFLINYIIHFSSLLIITKFRYQFKFNHILYRTMLIGFVLCALGFMCSLIPNIFWKYSSGVIISIIAISFSIWQFNEHLNLKDLIMKVKQRFIK